MFDANYYRKRQYLIWRAPIICFYIKQIFNPISVMDFGCSIGDLVHGFNNIGIPSIGFDSSEEVIRWAMPETPIFIKNITQPLDITFQFDLSLCIEVLRFVPDDKLPGLLHNIYCHSKRVVIGYGGDRKDYIVKTMLDFGFVELKSQIDILRTHLEPWKSKPAIKALYHGGMYFLCGQ